MISLTSLCQTCDKYNSDIQERHLLRLGAGSSDIYEHSQKDFSKWGRVNMTLSRRLHLLGEVRNIEWMPPFARVQVCTVISSA